MNTDAISANKTNMLQEQVGVAMLKKGLDFQADAAMKLLESLPVMTDPDLGKHVDTTA